MRDEDALENNPAVSRSALEAIHSQVFGWALSRCSYDPATAEDLMQQAYVEILSGKARFGGRSSLKTFVFSVVQNLARGSYRRKASRLRLVQQLRDSEPDLVQAAVEPQAPSIWHHVQNLPARQRDIIELVFCRELSIEDASKVMGVTVGTGRVHYDRAKKALRLQIGEER